MKRVIKNILLFPVLVLVFSISLLISCGGEGGVGGGRTSSINGRVSDVTTAMTPREDVSVLALIKDFLLETANAQGSGVSGITVTAIVDGTTVDTDITDAEGNFTLTASGNVTLVFTTDEFSVSVGVFVPQGSTINVVLTLRPDEPDPEDQVEIENMEIDGTIRCETGTVDIEGVDLAIDGGGEDNCIRVEGNCTLRIQSDSLTLSGCERCIDAGGTAGVTIISGDITCDAREDGIRSRGDSDLTLDADGSIIISGGENGIRAEGNSNTSLSASGDISIVGQENGIRADGNSVVGVEVTSDVGLCTIGGRESPIRQDGTSTVNIDTCIAAPLP
jgi:hypothetical protein